MDLRATGYREKVVGYALHNGVSKLIRHVISDNEMRAHRDTLHGIVYAFVQVCRKRIRFNTPKLCELCNLIIGYGDQPDGRLRTHVDHGCERETGQ